MDAFSGSEYTYWWGPISAIWSWSEERIRRRFGDPGTQQFKVVDDTNGAIVAWAKWDPPPQMMGLSKGFVVYDEAGQPISLDADMNIEEGKGKGEGEGGKATTNCHVLGPPEGANAALFKTFFDGIVGMEKKHHAGEKLGTPHRFPASALVPFFFSFHFLLPLDFIARDDYCTRITRKGMIQSELSRQLLRCHLISRS